MLYGIEEYDYDEFGILRRQKLNTKKVVFAVLIVIAAIAIVVASFFMSFFLDPDRKTNSDLAVAPVNEIAENTVIQENVQQSEQPNDIENDNLYKGRHSALPEHDVVKLSDNILPVFNERGAELIKNIYKSEEKQVYLTFDDGPSKEITGQVLDIIKQEQVPATFFVLGARVELYPEVLQRAYNEGHYIANHGYSHIYSEIYQNKDTVFAEYIDCENSIKRALNNDNYSSFLFRFPGGSSGGYYKKVKSEARELLNSYGFAFTNWNCLTGDAEGKNTKEECIQEFIDTKGEQNSLIVLMHDSNDKPQTVEALPEIIKILKDEGYIFKNFYEIFK